MTAPEDSTTGRRTPSGDWEQEEPLDGVLRPMSATVATGRVRGP